MNFKEECIELWSHMATHGGSKRDYFILKNLDVKTRHLCFACEKVKVSNGGNWSEDCCIKCPIAWVPSLKVVKPNSCLFVGSTYRAWADNPTKENAAKVLETISNTWKEH